MNILVFSDTHGKVANMVAAIGRFPEISTIIHLGDYGTDVDRLRSSFPDHQFFSVSGNCDSTRTYPAEQILELAGTTLLLTHGHLYGVKDRISALVERAKEVGAAMVLYGHSHRPLIQREEGILVLNPGSASFPRTMPRASYAILTLGAGEPRARILDL